MYWSIGTTSFRVGNHLVKNKVLLEYLNEFWSNQTEWNSLTQPKLYDIATKNGLVKGTAQRKDKDARQITSGLVDIGLVTNKRKITSVGNAIMESSNNTDDLFLLEEDNYIYLKQFLKLQIGNLRPFVALIYLLEKLDYLTYDEFTYLLPICFSINDIKEITNKIKLARNGNLDFNEVIIEQIRKVEKIDEAIQVFSKKCSPTLDDFIKLDMNRKSSIYSEPIQAIYEKLKYYYDNKDLVDISYFIDFKEALKNLSTNLKKQYSYYFKINHKINDSNLLNLKNHFDKLSIFQQNTINEFNNEFGCLIHVFKWKSTLEDYADLNKRYFMLPNIIKCMNNKFELDILPKYIFMDIIDELLETPIIKDKDKYRNLLESNVSLLNINELFNIKLSYIIPKIQNDYGISNLDEMGIKTFIEDKKLEQINELIDNYFMPEQLIALFKNIEIRNDKALMGYANIEPDVTPSTLLEYFSAIAWYHVSDRKGNLLKFMKLKLDANLLPLTHAPGYYSDIVFNYDKTEDYDKHDVMMEVTLSDSTGQRRMEMEPVTRHLVNYKKDYPVESYCIFIANELHTMVLSDFRSRKAYYYEVGGNVQQGLKIIPLSTNDLSVILEKNISYAELYSIFDKAYKNNVWNDIEWYQKCIKEAI